MGLQGIHAQLFEEWPDYSISQFIHFYHSLFSTIFLFIKNHIILPSNSSNGSFILRSISYVTIQCLLLEGRLNNIPLIIILKISLNLCSSSIHVLKSYHILRSFQNTELPCYRYLPLNEYPMNSSSWLRGSLPVSWGQEARAVPRFHLLLHHCDALGVSALLVFC